MNLILCRFFFYFLTLQLFWGSAHSHRIYDDFDKDGICVSHKALHFGFGMGVALNPKDWVKAGIAGGTAAVVSEVLAEGLIGSPEELQRNPIDPESVKGRLFFAKAIGAIAGSLICEGADPMAAMLVARNAVENNFEYTMRGLFEDQLFPEETWEDRVEQERLAQEAYTGFRSSLVGKAESIAGRPGKVAVDFLMPSHHNLIVPELMMNISGAAAGVKFFIKAPKYAPNVLRIAPKAFDVTKGFLRNLINPRQLVKTLPKKDAALMTVKRNVKGGVTSVTHTQKHHIVHQSLKDHELIQLADFNIHNPANIMLLPTKTGAKLTTTSRAVHQGRHTDEVVRALRISMNKVAEVGKAVGYTQEQYKQALLRIIAGERLELKMGLKSL